MKIPPTHVRRVSMRRMFVGFGISLVLGIVMGIAIARFRAVELTLGSLVAGLQAGTTVHAGTGSVMPLRLAAERYHSEGASVVVVAGDRHGCAVSNKKGALPMGAPLNDVALAAGRKRRGHRVK